MPMIFGNTEKNITERVTIFNARMKDKYGIAVAAWHFDGGFPHIASYCFMNKNGNFAKSGYVANFETTGSLYLGKRKQKR